MLTPQESSSTSLRLLSPNRRLVSGLRTAALTSRELSSPRTKGTKAEGRAYERKVAKHFVSALPQSASHFIGPWIRYEDDNGFGYAQPDYIGILNNGVGLIVEAKRTRCADAREQLVRLYLPLARKLWPEVSRWVLIAASRYWAGAPDLPQVKTPAEAAKRGLTEEICSATMVDYHWKG